MPATGAATHTIGDVTFGTAWDDDAEREGIPPDLDTMRPDPVLAGWLSTIDRSRLSGHDRIIVLRADQRMASHHAAHVYADMASVVDAIVDVEDVDPDLAAEAAAAEVRAALRLTRQAADAEVVMALDLRNRLRDVFAMLAAGEIDPRRARTIDAASPWSGRCARAGWSTSCPRRGVRTSSSRFDA